MGDPKYPNRANLKVEICPTDTAIGLAIKEDVGAII
jgi:hypothetical protein